MSGVVVLRCPNCGTTKAAPGECEACHEAKVRYFCTNHSPGRWLDGPACPDCGARLGDPARPAATPRPPSPARVPAPTPVPAPAPTSARRREADGGPWAWRGPRRPPSPEDVLGAPDEGAATRDAPRVRLPGIVTRAASRVRRTPRGASHVPEEAPAVGPALGGCLMRALLLAVFLLISLITMSVLVGGSLLQNFGIVYYW